MLVRFSVENFLSFRERAELSMVASGTRRHLKHVVPPADPRGFSLLRLAILYGANASGKSNLVRAIDRARQIILEPADAGKQLAIIPFKLDKAARKKPSRFEFEIKVGTKYFAYGFVASAERIHEEWLYEFDLEAERPIFERDGAKFDLHGFQISDHEKQQFLEFTARGTPATRLFLAECKQRNLRANIPEAQPIFDVLNWFDETLSVVFPDSSYAPLLFRVHEDKRFKSELARYLRCFDTGIENIDLQEEDFENVPISPADRKKMTEELREGGYALVAGPGHLHWLVGRKPDHSIDARRLMARHSSKNGAHVGFGMDEESDGTRRLMHLAPAMMLSVTSDRLFVIDELNRSLHPDISRSYLQSFLRYSENRASQLIVTTHETTLLSLRLFRPDEIWFVEKGADQASRLLSLNEFRGSQLRADVLRDYAHGRFGAIPVLEDLSWLGEKNAKGS
jgi:AAA15 family ATPase/GTPase